MENDSRSFEEVKARLDEIVEAVSDEELPLDDALKLYEEAVQLGLAASSLLEENIDRSNAQFEEDSAEDAAEESSEAVADEAVEDTADQPAEDPAEQPAETSEPITNDASADAEGGASAEEDR